MRFMGLVGFVLAALLVAGCGFQLRGERALGHQVRNLYLEAAGAPEISRELRESLQLNGVALAREPDAAELIVTLGAERFATRVISVDPATGKVREYEIDYSARVNVKRPDGTSLIEGESIEMVREFTFDETAVLGKLGEEAELRRLMVRDAADNLLRRLEALQLEPAAGPA